MRRFYLLANQMGWKNRDSAIFDVDEFAIHQIGYHAHIDSEKEAEGRKFRRQKTYKQGKDRVSDDLADGVMGLGVKENDPFFKRVAELMKDQP